MYKNVHHFVGQKRMMNICTCLVCIQIERNWPQNWKCAMRKSDNHVLLLLQLLLLLHIFFTSTHEQLIRFPFNFQQTITHVHAIFCKCVSQIESYVGFTKLRLSGSRFALLQLSNHEFIYYSSAAILTLAEGEWREKNNNKQTISMDGILQSTSSTRITIKIDPNGIFYAVDTRQAGI